MWASRDKGTERIELWTREPHFDVDGLVWLGERSLLDGRMGNWHARFNRDLKLSPGECVEIEDIKLVRKAKPKRRAKR